MNQPNPSLNSRNAPRSRRGFLTGTLAAGLLPRVVRAVATEPPNVIVGLTEDESREIRAAVDGFMTKHNVPGLTLAIARGARLLLAEGFGVANVETGEPVTPRHRFRVASVSKPITSVAIMRLVEQERLTLDQQVFAASGPLASFYNPRTVRRKEDRDRIEAVTLEHLLTHTSGGWGNKQHDPMFDRAALEFDHAALIRWVLARRPLEHDPGDKYDYSNFGYCLLSRVIEAITGEDYETHVRAHVLEPSGAVNTRIALEETTARLPDEVEYVGQEDDPNHKAMRVRRMDGHGGWVSSAIDLVRFVSHVDGFAEPPDLLTQQTIQQMTQSSAANAGYAKGWSVNRHDNWWHIGSFNGASSIIVRTRRGLCWAMLVNTRSKATDYTTDLDALPWKIVEAVRRWPDHDLYSQFDPGDDRAAASD